MKKKLLIEIGHPAHIHHFRNLYMELTSKGWDVMLAGKDKEMVLYLAEYYKLPFKKVGKTKNSMVKKLMDLPFSFLKLLFLAIKFNPSIMISRVSPLSGWVSFLLRKPHITFADTETVEKLDRFSEPFADYIFTSVSFRRTYSVKKHFRYHGSHELAYLHPNRFEPDISVLKDLGLKDSDKYAILRFVAWEAHHDVGEYGLTEAQKEEIVAHIEKSGLKVFISSEKGLSEELKKYTIQIPPKKMHDALYFASLYAGESSTMAEEAATLGIPSICVSSLAGKTGVIQDLVKAKLLLNFHPDEYDNLIKELISILEKTSLLNEWKTRKEAYLRERIDVSGFYAWLVENYPNSIAELKKNKNYDKKFITHE